MASIPSIRMGFPLMFVLIGFRQAKRVLRNERQHQLRCDRRDAEQDGFAHQTLDMVFLGISETAECQLRGLRRLHRRFAGQVFARVGFVSTRLASIVKRAGVHCHEVGRFQFGPAGGQGVLHTLVLADRPAKHDTLIGVIRGAAQRVAPDANCFGGNQNPFGVQPVQDLAKALTFLADQILGRNRQAVDEQLV